MQKIRKLTVNENNGDSESYAVCMTTGMYGMGALLHISISIDGVLKIVHGNTQITASNIDRKTFNDLYSHMGEAKEFLEEEDAIYKLVHGTERSIA